MRPIEPVVFVAGRGGGGRRLLRMAGASRTLGRLVLAVGLSIAAAALSACVHPEPRSGYDLVLVGGRVIDPESGLDGVRNVGIRDGSIAAITTRALGGAQSIDVRGLVVTPGFIDIHSHSPTPFGAKFQVLDGVTTQLDLEAGAFPVEAYGEFFDHGSPVHYGASVGHLAVRAKVLTGHETPHLISRQEAPAVPEAFVQQATDEQISAMRVLLEQGIDAGGIGIGVLLDYISVAVRPAELRMIFEVAGSRNVPVFVHVRRGLPGDPAGLIEVIALAEETGAPLLVCHIAHSAMQSVGEWLARIDAANARGARITTETLTYAAGGTSIGAAVFGRDWQRIFGITYEDVQWTATGEWLTRESFERYRREAPHGAVNHHYVEEAWIETALRWPAAMVVSDATPAFGPEVLTNPNLSGSFSRFLGHYSRDAGLLPLREALARTSLHQAKWLAQAAPAFDRKGRVQRGMDADLVVFDPARIAANASYGAPYRSPDGIVHVIVAGEVVVRSGVFRDSALAGQRLLGGTRKANRGND